MQKGSGPSGRLGRQGGLPYVAIWLILAGAAAAQTVANEQGKVIVEVRDALTQAPLPEARVRIENRERGAAAFGATAATGTDGSALFSDVALSARWLTAEHAGYTRVEQALRVTGGTTTDHVTVQLTPLGSIAGRVLDEDGQPVAGVLVYTRQPGFAPRQRGETDRTGSYRAGDLAAGDYRLEFRVPFELRAKTAVKRKETGETFAYPPVISYPDATDLDGGIAVHATAGTAVQGIDLHLRRALAVEFTGQLIDRVSRGPVPGARLSLISPLSPYFDPAYNMVQPGNDGSFHFDLIPPGRYDLRIQNSDAAVLPATLPMDIGKSGITNLAVMAPEPQRLAGWVEPLQGEARWDGEIRLHLQGMAVGVSKVVREGGEFAIDNVPPGQWRLEASANSARTPDRKKLAVAGIKFGGQDALAELITVAESGNPALSVTLTGDTGRIAGTVQTDPVPPNAKIYLRRAQHAMLQDVTVKSDGSFLFEDLAPGSYELSETVDGARVRVEVKAGQTSGVSMRATP